MKKSIFDRIKTLFKITSSIFSFIRFLVIILLFVFIFNLLFTIDFDTLKTLPMKEKILYIFKYPTKFVQVKKDSKNAMILISAIQQRLDIVKKYINENINNSYRNNIKVRDKKLANLQEEEGYVKQAISEGENLVILRFDGTVLASGNNDFGQCNVSNWNDIYEIGVGVAHTVGLKKDETVVATGNNDYGQCNVSKWTNIKAIGAGNFHTIGLKDDGTVVATGNNDFGQCNVSKWTNIIKIKVGENFTIGLQEGNKEFVVGKRTATMKAAIEKMKQEEIERMKQENIAEIKKDEKNEKERLEREKLEKEMIMKEEQKREDILKEEAKKKDEKKKTEIKELEVKEIEI